MRKPLGLLCIGAVAALTFVAVASSAYSPTLSVKRSVSPASISTDVTFSQTQADDATARVVIYVPIGSSATLDQAVGTQIGSLEGQVFAADLAAVVPVAGSIVVADKSSAQAQTLATACTGKAAHDAIWTLNVSAAGSNLAVPAYVDRVTLPFASASVTFCLSHPSQVVFKIRLLNATLHLANVFASPAAAGPYRWTAVATPWEATNVATNNEATVETQAIDRTPVSASFSAKRTTKTRKVKRKGGTDIFYTYFAKLTGQARQAGQPAADASVNIMVGDKRVATTTSNANGSFSATLKLTKTTTFRAVISKDSTSSTATCDPRLLFPGTTIPITCSGVTEGGFTVTSGDVTVKKPKLTVKHIKAKKKKKKK